MKNPRANRPTHRRLQFEPLEGRELLTIAPNNVLGAMGDSVTNALRYAPPNPNWVVQLTESRGINFGTGTPGHTYDYDEASIGGNTNADNAAHLQAPALAGLINGGAPISAAVLEVGSHDLGPIGPTPSFNDDSGNPVANTYFSIYNGQLTGGNLAAYIDRTVGYIVDAASTITATGVRMVVANIPDFGDVPQLQTLAATANPAQRQLVTQAVDAANAELRTKTDAVGIPLLDFKGLIDLSLQPLVVGGVTITSTPAIGSPPAFYMDSQHPGGVANGLLANMVIEALDGSYGYNIAPLTDQEILVNSGLTAPTNGPTYFDVTRFVHSIDQVAPGTTAAVTASTPGSNGWSTDPVTITLSATDNLFGSGVVRTQYSLDGGQTWLATSNPTLANVGPYGSTGTMASTVTLSRDGVSHLLYRSIDGAGNVEDSHPLTVMIDSTAPINLAGAVISTPRHSEGDGVTATIVGIAFDNLSGVDTASATYTVTDSQGQTISNDSVTLTPLFAGGYAYQFKVTLARRQNGQGPTRGRNTITVSLKDLAGNTSSASIVVFVPQDQGHEPEGKTSSASVAWFDPATPITPAEIAEVEKIGGKNSAAG